jgi:type VII secretion protein EccE
MVTAMTSHAAPAAEMMLPPAFQPAVAEIVTAAPALSRGAAALDWIAPVRTWQTVAWEAATLAVAAGYGRSPLTEAAAYAGAGALVGMSSLRVHGRCLGQWTDTQGRYRYRKLAARRRAEAGAAVEPLATLLPDLALGGYVDRAGNRVGLAASDGGWVAAVRLGPAVEPDAGALVAVLREAFADTTIPLASAQLLVWTAAGPSGAGPVAPAPDPAPHPAPDSDPDPADLTATVTHAVMPPGSFPSQAKPQPSITPAPNRGPMRVYWLALRYRPRQAPHAAMARGGGELGAARAVASAALSLVSRLDSAGYPADALDQFELGQELLVALNAGDPSPGEVRESWRDWSTGHLQQVCYEPHRSLDPAGLLDRWAPEAAFTCSSYTLSRTPRGRIRSASALRVAGPDAGGLESPVPAVRANGRHREFVLRTLPLAVP